MQCNLALQGLKAIPYILPLHRNNAKLTRVLDYVVAEIEVNLGYLFHGIGMASIPSCNSQQTREVGSMLE